MITSIPKASIIRLQTGLKKAGYYAGKLDGGLGPMTLQALASFVTSGRAPTNVGPLLDKWLPFAEITTRRRLISFFAHVAHESGFTPGRENLNYSVSGLLANFGAHRISRKDVDKFGRTQSQAADQKGIANAIYGGPWGLENLGNTEPTDGWAFRGGGGIQLTGRAMYRAIGNLIGMNLEANPSMITDPEVSIAAAVGFWKWKGLNEAADLDDTAEETHLINGGNKGLAERRALKAIQIELWP